MIDIPCPVCASEYRVHLRDVGTSRTKKAIPLYYCMECQSFTCSSGYKEDGNMLASDVLYHTNGMAEKEPYLKRFVNDLSQMVKFHKWEDYADVGCGVGHLVSLFAPIVKTAHGYDINDLAIDEGRRLFPNLTLSYANFLNVHNTYDLVTFIDTFEHIPNPIEFLNGVKERLNPGGFVYISVPQLNADNWTYLLHESVEEQMHFPIASPFHDCDVHCTHYSATGLRKLAEACGLRVFRTFQEYWPLDGILMRKPL